MRTCTAFFLYYAYMYSGPWNPGMRMRGHRICKHYLYKHADHDSKMECTKPLWDSNTLSKTNGCFTSSCFFGNSTDAFLPAKTNSEEEEPISKTPRFRMFRISRVELAQRYQRNIAQVQRFLAIGLTMDLTETGNRAWNVSGTQCQFS